MSLSESISSSLSNISESDTETNDETETSVEKDILTSKSNNSESISSSLSKSKSLVTNEKEIDNFYKLKAKYDEKISKIKNKIKNKETLTKKDKQKEFKNTKFKCINCNKPGGTLFEIKQNKLTALCGANVKCDLNMNIDKKTYYNIRDEKNSVEEQINLTKTDIIKIKLDFLFNYIEESDVIKEFNIQKEDLDIFVGGLISTKKDYIEIVDNIEKNSLLKESIIALHKKILEIKEKVKCFNGKFIKIYANSTHQFLLKFSNLLNS